MKILSTTIFLQMIQSNDTSEKCIQNLDYKNHHPIFSTEAIWDYCNEVWNSVIKSHKFISLFQSKNEETIFRGKNIFLKDKFISNFFNMLNVNGNEAAHGMYQYTDDDLKFVDSFTKSAIDMLETSNKCGDLRIGTSTLDFYKDVLKQIIEHRFFCEKVDGLFQFRFLPCKDLEFIKRFECGLTEAKNYTVKFFFNPDDEIEPNMFRVPLLDINISNENLDDMKIVLYCLVGICVLLGILLIFQELLFRRRKKNSRSEVAYFDVADDTVEGKSFIEIK